MLGPEMKITGARVIAGVTPKNWAAACRHHTVLHIQLCVGVRLGFRYRSAEIWLMVIIELGHLAIFFGR